MFPVDIKGGFFCLFFSLRYFYSEFHNMNNINTTTDAAAATTSTTITTTTTIKKQY